MWLPLKYEPAQAKVHSQLNHHITLSSKISRKKIKLGTAVPYSPPIPFSRWISPTNSNPLVF